ncbi:MAG: ABC transporter ATP-binding protein, partial [Candidatus Marinimicrobia bacterium]|nr:ABC transporter ATP-binding protein [Candidatus Neomarinimicrobiota bacterium]
ILSDVIFIREGKVVLFESMETLKNRYFQVIVSDDKVEDIRKMNPVSENRFFGKSVFLMENIDKATLEELGEVKSPSISDIFVVIMGGQS